MRCARNCLLVLLVSLGAYGADLGGIKTIYVMSMSRGLDQYLAQQLTMGSRFQVVTDPKKADAFFTDRLGSSFEDLVTELLAPKSDVSKESGNDGNGNAGNKDDPPFLFSHPTMQPLSMGKGNVFLVDNKTHTVIWSAFIEPNGSAPKDLSQQAGKIVERLNFADVKGQKK
jgi:hypothetical protein